ncbi:alpha/beta fold hydrolase [Nakamurella lactea]|uniref:alpha/beta fold hydrolase n=1 Tax=Nakamurella lactea TaxID=459515 RepID=UPI00041220CC|nr:alpha/beta hydrolase [Nakamurella lactea]
MCGRTNGTQRWRTATAAWLVAADRERGDGVIASQLSPHHAAPVLLRTPAGILLAALDTGIGEPSDRPTVLLLPGYTGSKEDFAPILDPLADNGFRAIAVDLPGQHESPGPADEAAYLPEPLGRVIAELIGTLPAPVVLVGHSYGGLVARAATIVGARLAALVLLDSGPGALPAGARLDALVVGAPILRESGVEAAYAVRAGLTAQLRDPAAQALEDFYRHRFVSSTAAGLLGMATGLQSEPDRTAELAAALAAIEAGIAVISGEADDAWGIQAQADMARRLGGSLVPIAGAAHSPAVEQPDRLLRVLLPLMRSWTARR